MSLLECSKWANLSIPTRNQYRTLLYYKCLIQNWKQKFPRNQHRKRFVNELGIKASFLSTVLELSILDA